MVDRPERPESAPITRQERTREVQQDHERVGARSRLEPPLADILCRIRSAKSLLLGGVQGPHAVLRDVRVVDVASVEEEAGTDPDFRGRNRCRAGWHKLKET
jgi:hypothetical protein